MTQVQRGIFISVSVSCLPVSLGKLSHAPGVFKRLQQTCYHREKTQGTTYGLHTFSVCHCQNLDHLVWRVDSLSELRSPCQVLGLSVTVRTQIILSGAWTLCHCQYSDHPVRCLDSVTVSIQIILSGAWTLLLSELRSSCQVPGLCYCKNSDHPVRCLDLSLIHISEPTRRA